MGYQERRAQQHCGGGAPHAPQLYRRARQPQLQLGLVAVRAVLPRLRVHDDMNHYRGSQHNSHRILGGAVFCSIDILISITRTR